MKESNDDTYIWKDINTAMMQAGHPTRTIMKLIKNLRNEALNPGAKGDDQYFMGEHIHDAMMASGLPPRIIAKFVSNLSKIS